MRTSHILIHFRDRHAKSSGGRRNRLLLLLLLMMMMLMMQRNIIVGICSNRGDGRVTRTPAHTIRASVAVGTTRGPLSIVVIGHDRRHTGFHRGRRRGRGTHVCRVRVGYAMWMMMIVVVVVISGGGSGSAIVTLGRVHY